MPNWVTRKIAESLTHFIKSNLHQDTATAFTTAFTTDQSSFGFGEESDIPLEKIVRRFKTNTKFDYTCQQLMAYSVGSGFTNTVNSETPRAKGVLDMINDFTNHWELQRKNKTAAYEVYASGNTFYNTPGEGDKIDGLYYIPLTSIIRINRDDSEVIEYEQRLGSRQKLLPADQVAHFKMGEKNGEAFGEGIGQPMERKGVGYKASNGKYVRKPAAFDADEMISDVVVKMIYAGMPKYIISPKDKDTKLSSKAINALREAFNKTDPLKSVITSDYVDIVDSALSTQSKHDTFIDKHEREFVIGMKSPFIPLIANPDFSYASSETALNTALPIIKLFRTDYAKFIQDEIYRPLTIQDGKNPDKIITSINWVSIDTLDIDTIIKADAIASRTEFVDLIDPLDSIRMLNEVGTNYTIKEDLPPEIINRMLRENQIQKAIATVADNKEKANEVLKKVREGRNNL